MLLKQTTLFWVQLCLSEGLDPHLWSLACSGIFSWLILQDCKVLDIRACRQHLLFQYLYYKCTALVHDERVLKAALDLAGKRTLEDDVLVNLAAWREECAILTPVFRPKRFHCAYPAR
jgi:hypothetical protein